MADNRKICGFCGRPSSHLTTLSIEGNHIDFCDECLTLCLEISEEYNSKFGANAVEEVETENVNETVIYDLAGRRVNAITDKGVYIVNGKKVIK